MVRHTGEWRTIHYLAADYPASGAGTSAVRVTGLGRIAMTTVTRIRTAIPAATRNARSRPAASACWEAAAVAVPAACAARALLAVTVQATLPSTASPRAPPSWRPVLSRLDAIPES